MVCETRRGTTLSACQPVFLIQRISRTAPQPDDHAGTKRHGLCAHTAGNGTRRAQHCPRNSRGRSTTPGCPASAASRQDRTQQPEPNDEAHRPFGSPATPSTAQPNEEPCHQQPHVQTPSATGGAAPDAERAERDVGGPATSPPLRTQGPKTTTTLPDAGRKWDANFGIRPVPSFGCSGVRNGRIRILEPNVGAPRANT